MDQLFLLKPNFTDNTLPASDRFYYCPYCAAIEGLFVYFPGLREKVQITYVDFKRPRPSIVSLVGEANQGCPLLVLDEKDPVQLATDYVKEAKGRKFISSWIDIMNYLAERYSLSYPHP